MFDATKSKFRDVDFQKLDVDDPSTAELKSKYQVTGIPRVVFLDASGNVLYNGGVSRDPVAWEARIKQFHD